MPCRLKFFVISRSDSRSFLGTSTVALRNFLGMVLKNVGHGDSDVGDIVMLVTKR